MAFALVGALQIDRIGELENIRVPIDVLLDNLHRAQIEAKRDQVPGGCYDFATGDAILTLQGWIVRTPHHVVLIDSCAGNDKPRPGAHWIDHLNTPWLDTLAGHGLAPEAIDYVMCTHLHADHVGWNTRLLDGRWVPTFPNARYLFGKREYEHWQAIAETGEDELQRLVFEDSVLPCINAGAVELVDFGFSLDDSLWVEAAPGHTVGNAIIRARSEGETALFLGDVMHSPLQTVFPEVNHVACELSDASRATRRRLLEEAAEERHLLVPAHFSPPYIGRVSRRGDAFVFAGGPGAATQPESGAV